MSACNVTWKNETAAHDADEPSDASASSTASAFVIGVLLSIGADILIAASLNLQKLAHNRNAGADGKPQRSYVRLPLWWAGLLLNMTGEVGNMLAYGFAPAAVVAPLGSVGVIVNEIIAVCCLKEPFRRRDAFGLVGIVAGVVMIIFSVPESGKTLTASVILADYLSQPSGYVYLICLAALVTLLIVYFEPRYARRYLLVWLMLCSLISSVTVIAARGFSSMLTSAGSDCAAETCLDGVVMAPCSQTLAHWLFWVLASVIGVTAVWSAIYLNKAMMTFGNTETVPTYYCTFTLASIVGSAVVYDEFGGMALWQGFLFAAGCVMAFSGVWLITSMRDEPRSEEFRKLPPEQKIAELQRNVHSNILPAGALLSPRMYMARDAITLHGEELAEQIRLENEAERNLRHAATLASARGHYRPGAAPPLAAETKTSSTKMGRSTTALTSSAFLRLRNALRWPTREMCSSMSAVADPEPAPVAARARAPSVAVKLDINSGARDRLNELGLTAVAQAVLNAIGTSGECPRAPSPAHTASPTSSASSDAGDVDTLAAAAAPPPRPRRIAADVALRITDTTGAVSEVRLINGEWSGTELKQMPRLDLGRLGALAIREEPELNLSVREESDGAGDTSGATGREEQADDPDDGDSARARV